MKKPNALYLSNLICQTGIVPLFAQEDSTVAKKIVDALYAGGIRIVEFTNRKENAFEVFSDLVEHVHQYPDFMLGIGTVMDVDSTEAFLDEGAAFIVSPIVKEEMGEACSRNKVLWIPGCSTPTEVVKAMEAGAGIVKIFPGSVLGPEFVRSVITVIPDVRLMISGGVEPTEASIDAWFSAGAQVVGLGSQLFTADLIAREQWKELTNQVASCLALAHRLKTR